MGSRTKMRQQRADSVQADLSQNLNDKISLNSLQLIPKLHDRKYVGVNNFSPGKLTPISESEYGSPSKLLNIPHLDVTLDPLLVLANSRTSNDTRKREAHIMNVRKFEKTRTRNLLKDTSSASNPSNSFTTIPLMNGVFKTKFSPLSSMKLMGTMGAVTQLRPRPRLKLQQDDINVDNNSFDEMSTGDMSFSDGVNRSDNDDMSLGDVTIGSKERSNLYDDPDDVSIGDCSVGARSMNSISSGIHSYHSSFN